jgi:hypothetical protein
VPAKTDQNESANDDLPLGAVARLARRHYRTVRKDLDAGLIEATVSRVSARGPEWRVAKAEAERYVAVRGRP